MSSALLEIDELYDKSESYVQQLIRDRDDVKKYIIDSLGQEYDGKEKFVPEVKFINGITVDFNIIKEGQIIALLECKSGEIGVTEYVRGIGQLLQYEYFYEESILPDGVPLNYSDNFQTIYFFPSNIIKNRNFNLARFKYPQSTKLLEINVGNYYVREIHEEEIQKLSEIGTTKAGVSQYYFRDNRLYELYILLQYLSYLQHKGVAKVNRSKLENEYLRKLSTQNNNNWRNAFITLSSLGFISNDNMLSETGKMMAIRDYPNFCAEILESYIKPYVEIIYGLIESKPNISLRELKESIESEFNHKPVLFMTDSETRYLSSWMNILRDDYGCLDFATRSSNRVIVYDPTEIKKEVLINKIKIYSKGSQYIQNYNELIKEGAL